jgi:hypothetical protein
MPCAGGCAAVRRSRCDRSQRRGRVRRRRSRRGSGDDGRRGVCQSEGMDPFRSSTEVLRFVPWSGGPWPGKPGGATLAVGGAQRRASALAPIIQLPVDEHHVDLSLTATVSEALPHPPPSIPSLHPASRLCDLQGHGRNAPSRPRAGGNAAVKTTTPHPFSPCSIGSTHGVLGTARVVPRLCPVRSALPVACPTEGASRE